MTGRWMLLCLRKFSDGLWQWGVKQQFSYLDWADKVNFLSYHVV